MRILIAGINYAPEPVGIGPYTAGLAEGLVSRGHEVRVVGANPYYPTWRTEPGYGGRRRGVENGVDVTRVPVFVPAVPSGAKRIAHHVSWLASSLPSLVARSWSWRPQIVLAIAPSLIGAPAALFAARLSGARTWLHIQDYEVEAAFATGLMDGRGWKARSALAYQRAMLRTFDRVSSISPEMCAKAVRSGVAAERVYEFRNWATSDAAGADGGSYRREWHITTPHVALYSGNIANKQGLDVVIGAARHLREREDLTFVICGNGPNRTHLEQLAQGLDNLQFHDLQPRERLPELLAMASVHLLPQQAGAADLVLPSKLTNMLQSGRPVVATADAETGLAREVEGCGTVTPPGDPVAMAAAIESLLADTEQYAIFSRNAVERAHVAWHRESILDRLEAEIVSAVSRRERGGAGR